MVKSVIRSYLLTVLAFWILLNYTGVLRLQSGLTSLLLVSLGFSLLHLIIKPVLETILGPLNFLTFGLIGIIIDAAILFALTTYLPQVRITPWNFPGAHVSGFTIPPFQFNIITGSVLSAAVIGIIHTVLDALMS